MTIFAMGLDRKRIQRREQVKNCVGQFASAARLESVSQTPGGDIAIALLIRGSPLPLEGLVSLAPSEHDLDWRLAPKLTRAKPAASRWATALAAAAVAVAVARGTSASIGS